MKIRCFLAASLRKKEVSCFQGFLNKSFGLFILPVHFVVILYVGNLIWSCTKALTE